MEGCAIQHVHGQAEYGGLAVKTIDYFNQACAFMHSLDTREISGISSKETMLWTVECNGAEEAHHG